MKVFTKALAILCVFMQQMLTKVPPVVNETEIQEEALALFNSFDDDFKGVIAADSTVAFRNNTFPSEKLKAELVELKKKFEDIKNNAAKYIKAANAISGEIAENLATSYFEEYIAKKAEYDGEIDKKVTVEKTLESLQSLKDKVGTEIEDSTNKVIIELNLKERVDDFKSNVAEGIKKLEKLAKKDESAIVIPAKDKLAAAWQSIKDEISNINKLKGVKKAIKLKEEILAFNIEGKLQELKESKSSQRVIQAAEEFKEAVNAKLDKLNNYIAEKTQNESDIDVETDL